MSRPGHHIRVSPTLWHRLLRSLPEESQQEPILFGVPVVVDPTVPDPPGYVEENKPDYDELIRRALTAHARIMALRRGLDA